MFAGFGIVIALLLKNPVAIVIGFIILASGIYSSQIVFWTVPSRVFSGVGAATGIGLINYVANLSGFTGPYLTGAIYTATGSYTPAFLTIAALVITGGIGFIVLQKRLPMTRRR